jgi:hypothetical protein
MKNKIINPQEINGWGVDADLENDPTYPIKKRTDEDHKGYSWERPEQQPITVEVLHSNERPNVSAVYGTATPPSGLSGMIRREAFKYSESSFAHWIPLILADRVNVVEGIVDDIRRGHFPNIFAEKGLGAEWKYNRKAFTRRIVTCAFIAAATVSLLVLAKKKK